MGYFGVEAEEEVCSMNEPNFVRPIMSPGLTLNPAKLYSGRPVIINMESSFPGLSRVRISQSIVAGDRILQRQIFAGALRVLTCAGLRPVSL